MISRKELVLSSQIIIYVILVGLLLTPTVNSSETSLQKITTSFSWQVGDNYAYQGLGRYGVDADYEIIGISAWQGEEVFNISYSRNISNYWLNYYHTTDTFDPIGYQSKNKVSGNINYTRYEQSYPIINIWSSDYMEGVYQWNFTWIYEYTNVYDPGQNISDTVISSGTLRQSLEYLIVINSETIPTPCGTFDCWNVSQAITSHVQNSSSQYVGGDTSFYNYQGLYNRINSTHTAIQTRTNINGTINEIIIYNTLSNRTYLMSKQLGISVMDYTYNYIPENDSWILWYGSEISTLNTQTPLTTSTATDIVSTTELTTTTASTTSEIINTTQSTTIPDKTTDVANDSSTTTTASLIFNSSENLSSITSSSTDDLNTQNMTDGWTLLILLPLITFRVILRKTQDDKIK